MCPLINRCIVQLLHSINSNHITDYDGGRQLKTLLKMFLAVAVILGLIFINVSCQKAEHNAEVKDVTKDKQEKEQNAAQEYADKLLKAKQDAKEAANATEQSQKDVNKAIDEIDKENNGK